MSLLRGEFYLDISKGNIDGHKMINKFGKNSDVSTTEFDALWSGGGEYSGFYATSAETVTVVSTDANDTLLGVGMRRIKLFGLDADGYEQTEELDMNGTTPVTSTLLYLRLDRARGLEVGDGTYSANNGDITIAQSVTTANVFAIIPIGYNTTMITAYTIPKGKTGYLYGRTVSIASKNASVADVRVKARVSGGVFTVLGEATVNSVGTGYISRNFVIPPELPELTDIVMEAQSSSSVALSGFLDILLVDNQ